MSDPYPDNTGTAPWAEERERRFDSVRQVHRCANGHVTELLWTAEQVRSAANENRLRFRCVRCDDSRAASQLEAYPLLEALGFVGRSA